MGSRERRPAQIGDASSELKLHLARLSTRVEKALHGGPRLRASDDLVEQIGFRHEPRPRIRESRVDRVLGATNHLGGKGRDPFGQVAHERDEIVVRQNLVHVPHRGGFLRGQVATAENDLQGTRSAHHLRETLRATAPGQNPERRFRLTEAGLGASREPHVERKQELRAPSPRDTGQDTHRDLWHPTDPLHDLHERVGLDRGLLRGVGEAKNHPHVRVGDEEIRVGTLKHEHAKVFVLRDAIDQPRELEKELRVQEVDRWVVDGHPPHTTNRMHPQRFELVVGSHALVLPRRAYEGTRRPVKEARPRSDAGARVAVPPGSAYHHGMEEVIRRSFAESIRAKEQFLAEHHVTLAKVARLLADTINQGHKILLFGNGGSAADAQHVAAEFTNRFRVERRPLPALALTTDTSALTAIGNDYSFEEIFSKQIEALGQAGDVAIAISTSGGSKNVLRAIDACGKIGLFVVGLTGGDGGAMQDQVDFLLNVSATREVSRIQECHILASHVLCELVDRQLFPAAHTGDAGT